MGQTLPILIETYGKHVCNKGAHAGAKAGGPGTEF